MEFKRLTSINGFDKYDLANAKQNNYVWSMGELNEYIYVGTGRNIALWPINVLKSRIPGFIVPSSVTNDFDNNRAEIWRYKKDGTGGWQRVFTAPEGIEGFRFMISHKTIGPRSALYVATSSNSQKNKIRVYKTTNGIKWSEVQREELKGDTSRAMTIHNGKLYIATAYEQISKPYLYSSLDPELYAWKIELDPEMAGFNAEKNPQGFIYNIASFNGHIYVSTSNPNGIQLWRTRGIEPKLNDWIMIADKGFGDESNTWSLSMTVFKNHLYLSATTELPKGYLFPRGSDIIRIDRNDKWELVVGGKALIPSETINGTRNKSLSGYDGGFSNPLNLYIWQMKEFKNELYVTTLDHGVNLQLILEIFILNRDAIKKYMPNIGGVNGDIDGLIKKLQISISEMDKNKYSYGFDMFKSHDGIKFSSVFLDGLGNKDNYGGRILFIDSQNQLYIGTANPYEGCEVWRVEKLCNNSFHSCNKKI